MITHAARTLLPHAPYEVKRVWMERMRWLESAHKFQLTPDGDWTTWLLKSGRGAGKTRTGAEDACWYCWRHPRVRYAAVARTYADARDVMIEGDSGVLSVLDRWAVDYDWNRSLGELKFRNGSRIDLYSADKPDKLRGPQHHRGWLEELASWKDAHLGDALHTTYNNFMLGLRLGSDPRVLVTTTPRAVKLIRELIADPTVVVSSGSTYDNRANLAGPFLDRVLRYEGTRIGRQELHGEVLEDVEGALFKQGWLDAHRLVPTQVPSLARVAVGVDPSGGAAEVGIVAAGLVPFGQCPCGNRPDLPHFAVVVDATVPGSSATWGDQVVSTFNAAAGDVVVGEANFGGDMVEKIVRVAARDAGVRVAYKPVRASRGKAIRAEPVSQAAEQGRLHMVGVFPELEDELTTWVPPGHADASSWSPNRLDALVWAVTELEGRSGRPTTSEGPPQAQLPRVG